MTFSLIFEKITAMLQQPFGHFAKIFGKNVACLQLYGDISLWFTDKSECFAVFLTRHKFQHSKKWVMASVPKKIIIA